MRSTRVLLLPAILGLALTTACGTSSTPTSSAESPAASTPVAATDPARSTDSTTPSASEGDVAKGDGTKTVYLVSMGFQHRYWQAVREGAEKAGKEFGYKIEFVGPDDETKVTQQLDLLKTALDTKPAALALAPLHPDAANSLLDQAKAEGIPVLTFDSGVSSDVPLAAVQTDNLAAAEEAAKHMIELIGSKGTVGLVCHDQTSTVGKERCDGFQNYVKEHAPDVKLLTPAYANEVGLAANTAKSLIQANPDLVGLYGSNEAAAAGAIQGKVEAGKKDVIVVGFDSGKTQIDAIRSGEQAGAVTQAPVRMGYETVVAAAKAIAGQSLPKFIDSGFAWYDKSNIDDPEIAQNLYE